MSERRNWGETVLGWFIVREGADAGPDGAGDEYGDAAAHGGEPGTPPEDPAGGAGGAAREPISPPPAATGGNVDFEGVFEAAGIDAEERARVERAAELLATLPSATDPAVKRQIVEASLKAFGVPVERIIEAGAHEIQALEGYIQSGARDTQQVLADGAQRVAELEQEIERVRAVMAGRTAEQKAVVTACNQRKLKIQAVLEFFGQEAVARVVSESPRLIDPSAGKT